MCRFIDILWIFLCGALFCACNYGMISCSTYHPNNNKLTLPSGTQEICGCFSQPASLRDYLLWFRRHFAISVVKQATFSFSIFMCKCLCLKPFKVPDETRIGRGCCRSTIVKCEISSCKTIS